MGSIKEWSEKVEELPRVFNQILLAQVMFDNPFMKLKWLHHLVVAKVGVTVITRHRNELTHSRDQITHEIRL